MDGGHVMDDEIPATPSVDEAIRALREYAQFEPQTRVMVWTPALATLVADALEAAARPAAGSSSPDVTALADELRDWPYGRPAFVRSEAEQAADALEAQATRITELERWKAEALVVLGQWDEVWEALGRPGPLGSSKAVEALTEAHRLRATDPPADVHPRHPRQETT